MFVLNHSENGNPATSTYFDTIAELFAEARNRGLSDNELLELMWLGGISRPTFHMGFGFAETGE